MVCFSCSNNIYRNETIMQIGKFNYNRCSQRMPCPVCERVKFCLVSDNGSLCICTKIISQKEYKSYHGWLHALGDTQYLSPKKVIKTKDFNHDPEYICMLYKKLNFIYPRYHLADRWNVTPKSLLDLGVGYSDEIYYLPMRNAINEIIGLQRIYPSDEKRTVKHSQLGIFKSIHFNPKEPVYIQDGCSDTAAMLSRGYNSLGRASESSCKSILRKLLKHCPQINIVPDNDLGGTGFRYAYKLAAYLYRSSCEINIMFNRDFKDIRNWINSGTFSHKKLMALRKQIS